MSAALPRRSFETAELGDGTHSEAHKRPEHVSWVIDMHNIRSACTLCKYFRNFNIFIKSLSFVFITYVVYTSVLPATLFLFRSGTFVSVLSSITTLFAGMLAARSLLPRGTSFVGRHFSISALSMAQVVFLYAIYPHFSSEKSVIPLASWRCPLIVIMVLRQCGKLVVSCLNIIFSV